MDKAHTQSRRTIAVLSPTYLTSCFTAPEWAARFAEDAQSQHDRLIPVRVRQCEPKGLQAQIIYLDLVDVTREEARQRLLKRVAGIRLKPDEEPFFPGSAKLLAAERLVPLEPRFPANETRGTTRALWNLLRRGSSWSRWWVAAILVTLALVALAWLLIPPPPERIPAQGAVSRLSDNTFVRCVIRFVAYNKNTEPGLARDKLRYIGREEHRFVFVADYHELQGYPVQQAVYKTGLSLSDKTNVTIIAFPLHLRSLYPANARGVLQVVAEVDKQENSRDNNYAEFLFSAYLTPEAINDLRNVSANSWAWRSYKEYYYLYEGAVSALLVGSYGAAKFIGDISEDWSGLGYSRLTRSDAGPPGRIEWKDSFNDDVIYEDFGARAFLIKNQELSSISDLYIKEFDVKEIMKDESVTVPYLRQCH